MELKKKITQKIASILRISEEQLTELNTISKIKEWDSMANVIILSSLEEEFGITFPEDILFELDSLDRIIQEISSLLPSR